MPAAPVETRARLLTDRRSGSLAAAFGDSRRALRIRHIDCAQYPFQTDGTFKGVHETLKARWNLLVSRSPDILRAAMPDCIRFDNHELYHEGIGNVAPADVYGGPRGAILRRQAAQESRTLARRVCYNWRY